MTLFRVLVIGGYGFFGSRVVKRLALQTGLDILLAGRNLERARIAAEEVSCVPGTQVRPAVVDANGPQLVEWLRAAGVQAVVHTSGPFQGQDYAVARACIQAGCHYIDLADGRAFVEGIHVLDRPAKQAGVLVASGASSVPALSSAAVDYLTAGLTTVSVIDIGISPGNRTDRGLATVQSILSYVGRPLPTGQVGWGSTRLHRYPSPVNWRLLSPCDVPDLTLLGARYPGSPRVRFAAGLELKCLHLGLRVGAELVRRGVVESWLPYATALKRISDVLVHCGTTAGAMHVTVEGNTVSGHKERREWALTATEGDGPFVPALAAAALVRKLATKRISVAGAMPCMGLLDLDDFLREAEGLSICFDGPAAPSLQQRALGDSMTRLPEPVARFHSAQGRYELHGEVTAKGPACRLLRGLAKWLGVPREDSKGPLRFVLDANAQSERWTRHFPSVTFSSTFQLERLEQGSRVIERMGPATLHFAVQASNRGQSLQLENFYFLGVRIPTVLWPRVSAREWAEHTPSGARLCFDVEASLRGLGRVAHYQGYLNLPERMRP